MSASAPLSYGQQRMWMLSQLAPDGALSLVMAVRLHGRLNVTALRQAFADIAARHQVLGSVVALSDGEPVQLPGSQPVAGLPVLVVDLAGLPDADAQGETERLLRAAERRPFDLAAGPLMRVVIVRTGPARHLVTVAVHHIVTDGWSVGLLAREVGLLYEAYLAGLPAPLAGTPTVQYAQFAQWQRAHDYGPALARSAARLAGLPGTGLPADSERPAADPARRPLSPAGTWTGALPPSVAIALGDLHRREGGSLFMLVLAGLMTVIHRLDGRREVAVGTLAAGRNRPELESALGYFGNTLVIRAGFDGQPTFRELWRRVRDDCVAAYADQDVPFEMVTAHLQSASGVRVPPIQVLCVMQQADPSLALPGLDAQPVNVPQQTALFDVMVEIRPRGGTLHLAIQYNTALFGSATIAMLGQYLRATLTAVATDPDLGCDQIPVAGQSPRRAAALSRLPHSVPSRPPAPGITECLPELFEAQAARTPDATAIAHRGRAVTYRQLNVRANQMARDLQAAGVGREDRVGILLDRSALSVAALLAILKAGAAYVPLDPAYPQPRLLAMVADSGAELIVTSAAHVPTATGAGGRPLVLDELRATSPHSGSNLGLPVSPDALACVLFTSGSTGRPSGVMIPHRGIVNRLRWMWRAYPFAPGERACHRTSLSFVDSIWEVLGPLLQGVTAEVIDPQLAADPTRLAAALSEACVTRVTVVPALLAALLARTPDLGRQLPALRLWVTSGERLPAELAGRFHELLPGRTLLNLYGSTEIAADATAMAVLPGAPALIGHPIDGVRATVTLPNSSPAPALLAGELLVSGAAVARGYVGSPGTTAARFVPDPGGGFPGARAFRTGDRVRTRADGSLEFVGRIDDQIQVRGHRVEPAEVEEALLRHPDVVAAAVAPYPDRDGSAAMAGYLVLGSAGSAEQVRDFAATILPSYLLPSLFIKVDALPLTPSGKVNRRELARPGVLRAATEHRNPAGQLPQTPAEQAVAAVFAELLPVAWRSADDDFFALGGHSLLATAALHQLRERHGADLDLVDLFAAPSIAGLARRIEQRPPPEPATAPGRGSRLPRPRPAAGFDPFPLTEVQQAYWVGRDPALELGNVATHAYFEVNTEGLDTGRLTAGMRALIERHPALRTAVRPDGTQQVLRTVPPYEVSVTDLRAAAPADVQAGLTEMREAMSHQVLPADRWPLFDIRVVRQPGGRERIGVSIDALIADAYSVQLLMRELGQLYHQPGARLDPIELTFRDCVVAEVESRSSAAYERALGYWRGRLASLPPGPDLPLTRSPADLAEPRFHRWSDLLPGRQWRELCERAARAGLTPTAVLLGAFTEILTAWSARPHYTVTLTLFNRGHGHPDLNRVVGDFTSLTLLEVDHREPGTFTERARRLHQQMWADLDHRQVSGVTVLREWARMRNRPPALIAPVVFTSNLGLPDEAGPAGQAEAGHELGRRGFGITQTPQLYLDHQVAQLPDGSLLLNWDVVADLFPPGLVDAAFAAYLSLLRRLAGQAGTWDHAVGSLVPEPQLRRRRTVNDTMGPRSSAALHDLVAAGAAIDPAAPAVITAGGTMSHAEVMDRAARVAHQLGDLGVRRGELVGIAMTKDWEQVVAVLGVAASGAAFVPLDPGLPAERLSYLRRATRLRYVLTQPQLLGRLPGLEQARQLAVGGDDEWSGLPGRLPTGTAGAGDLAYVIFTSGSTGTPKGVMIDHRGAVNTILDINQRFKVGPADRALGLSSLSFDLAIYDIFGLLAAGGAVVLPDHEQRRDPKHWLDLAGRAGVTIWNSVPALLGLAADHARAHGAGGLEELRLALLSGDWIPIDLPDRIRRLAPGTAVTSLGGATEASIWSVCYPVGPVDPTWSAIPYGRPLANQRLHVLDAALEPRPDWVPGDLHIAGDGLALGYWRDAERTAEAFVVHPRTGERLYRTGDVARYRADGNLDFLGREDLQVKINGFRVELGEVEAALLRIPGVSAGAVTAVGPRGEKRLAAYYVPEPGAEIDAPKLRARLGDTLPSYLVPGTFTQLPALPLSANGKVDRSALPADTPVPAGPPVPRAQRAGLVSSLAVQWAHVLGVERVGPDDNFFELGGTSLVGIRLLARLESELGVKIPLARLYREPTVAKLAEAIASAGDGSIVGHGSPAAVLQPLETDTARAHDPFPLTEVQEAYWLGRRAALQLGGVATHSYVELDVRGLDADRLESALARLVDRHPALRTVVLPDGRQQVLGGLAPYRLTRSDLRQLDPEARETRLLEMRDRMSHQVLPADRWPLFIVAATRIDDELTRLHVGIDLLVADALSFSILQRELTILYADPDAVLGPLQCTFRDYVLAVRQLRAGEPYQLAEQYWRGRVASLPAAPPLPLACGMAEISGPRFERREGGLDAGAWATLRQLAARHSVTPSGILCAAFSDVLAMWSQCGHFTLNLTTFNRMPVHPDVDVLVGDFTSTTLLEVDATAATFAERAGCVQEQIFRDLEHRAFSGVQVLRLLRADPARRADALAPVVFTSALLPGPTAASVGPGWDARPVYSVSQTPQVLLDHQVYEHQDALVYTWDHVAEAFPGNMIDAMFGAYGRLLHSLITDGEYWKAGPGWTR